MAHLVHSCAHDPSSAMLQSSSPPDTPAIAPPLSPFGAHRGVPRAHSAFIPTRTHAIAESGLTSTESAPAMALASLGSLDGDGPGADSPKKAGRLQHLKMRVAVSQHTSAVLMLPIACPAVHYVIGKLL